MNIRLSHYGWMVTRHLVNAGQLHLGDSPENDLLLDLWTGACAPYTDSALHNSMLAEGLIELADESMRREEIQLRYRRNPFEHVEKIIFEFTTYCNFNCEHCYNAQVPRLTESDPKSLADATDTFIRMGIRRFDFVGGEVSQHGAGWLNVVEQIRSRGADIIISLYTNGWWLEQEKFRAANQFYVSDQAYIEALKQRSVSHRGWIDSARLPLIRPEWTDEQVESFLAESATIIYNLCKLHRKAVTVSRLARGNYESWQRTFFDPVSSAQIWAFLANAMMALNGFFLGNDGQ